MFNWNLRVPYQYSNRYITLRELEQIMLRTYHPEYVRRFLAWLHYKNGNVGAGGLSRTEQPDKPGFAPSLAQTFHWAGQKYNDGVTAACAVDTVYKDGPDPGDAHDGIAWKEVPIQGSPEARRWGIHANVGVPGAGESWHIQPIEIDGHASWVAAGRPAPRRGYPIPQEHDPYYTPQEATAVEFYPVTQFRAADTRSWPGVPLEARKSYRFGVGDTVPADAVGVLATLTVTQTQEGGHLTVAKPGEPLFKTSCLNYFKDATLANTTFVPLLNRQFDIASHAPTHVVCDILGYFK